MNHEYPTVDIVSIVGSQPALATLYQCYSVETLLDLLNNHRTPLGGFKLGLTDVGTEPSGVTVVASNGRAIACGPDYNKMKDLCALLNKSSEGSLDHNPWVAVNTPIVVDRLQRLLTQMRLYSTRNYLTEGDMHYEHLARTTLRVPTTARFDDPDQTPTWITDLVDWKQNGASMGEAVFYFDEDGRLLGIEYHAAVQTLVES